MTIRIAKPFYGIAHTDSVYESKLFLLKFRTSLLILCTVSQKFKPICKTPKYHYNDKGKQYGIGTSIRYI